MDALLSLPRHLGQANERFGRLGTGNAVRRLVRFHLNQ